jgi:hypothetical protein
VPPSMFVITVFGTGNGTIGYVGQEADVNATELQLANTESNLDDLAHLYLAYEDPCLMENGYHPRIKYWRAFKGTVKLCLQTLKTIHNSSTHTEVADSHTNLTWTPSNNLTWNFNREFPPYGDNYPNWNWTTEFRNEDYTFDAMAAESLGAQLATFFNTSASFSPGDQYLFGSKQASDFIFELQGTDPMVYPNGTGHGREAFEKRLANIATGLTNA